MVFWFPIAAPAAKMPGNKASTRTLLALRNPVAQPGGQGWGIVPGARN